MVPDAALVTRVEGVDQTELVLPRPKRRSALRIWRPDAVFCAEKRRPAVQDALATLSRDPARIDSTHALEGYDDSDYGYLRIVVNAATMTIEFHPESDGGTVKTPDDSVTINLASRTIGRARRLRKPAAIA